VRSNKQAKPLLPEIQTKTWFYENRIPATAPIFVTHSGTVTVFAKPVLLLLASPFPWSCE
jgi:hypothetical protein